ncbi:MFS transporter [Pedobacter sp. SYSU D00535]|uniref:MFS transporter n=1 Tax=Pedobacter sp. SYSU D00535 TaxID=2810308 RepID=UPI001A961BE9|nr:MFS transporter [Pedobacter sp. SYSU D00535]
MENNQKKEENFSSYQKFIVAVLAILQFTIVLDFMVLSPLGAYLLTEMSITPSQFGLVVSAYAFSAGASGLLAAGFADRFDRKKLLLFFYTGFIIGTVLCGLAPSYHFLLIARIITGLFGGVISSISFAIITDLFALQVRGRVMGVVQMAFAASQVLGIPLGLYLADKFDWHAPFILIVGVSIIVGLVIWRVMKPVNDHLKIRTTKSPFLHMGHTLTNKTYAIAFLTTGLLSIGGFMLMPFSSAFLVHNVHIPETNLSLIFLVTGICSITTGPFIGKWSDKIGKFRMFVIGSVLAAITVVLYTNLSVSPIWVVIVINSFMFAGISSRMISSSALTSAVPEPQDRGAFMGINSSLQQISGGVASVLSGLIVFQPRAGAPLQYYDTVGYIVVLTMAVCIFTLYQIHKYVRNVTVARAQKVAE